MLLALPLSVPLPTASMTECNSDTSEHERKSFRYHPVGGGQSTFQDARYLRTLRIAKDHDVSDRDLYHLIVQARYTASDRDVPRGTAHAGNGPPLSQV